MTGEAAFQVLVSVFAIVTTALLTFTIFYLREIRQSFRIDQKKQDCAIEKLEMRMNDLPEKYLFREDFIRWSISVDKKMDDLGKNIQKLVEGGTPS